MLYRLSENGIKVTIIVKIIAELWQVSHPNQGEIIIVLMG